MSTAPATPVVVPVTSKTSWLKRVGSFLGKIGNIFVKEATTAEPTLAKAAEAMFPQFAPLIAMGDALCTKITKQIVVTEALGQAIGKAQTGQEKLQAVVAGIGPELDAWIQNLFPGAAKIEEAEKTGLVQAIVNIVNKQPGTVIVPS